MAFMYIRKYFHVHKKTEFDLSQEVITTLNVYFQAVSWAKEDLGGKLPAFQVSSLVPPCVRLETNNIT